MNLHISRRSLLLAALAASPTAVLLAACGDSTDDARVRFLNWQDYIDPDVLDRFRDDSGLTVTYETYASNDELEDRLTLSGTTRRRGREAKGFDLVVPSENLLRRLIEREAVQSRDASVSLDALDPAVLDIDADPGNVYSVPWATGSTGIGYARSAFPDGPPDWSVFGDDAFGGRMSLLDERREAFAAALFSMTEDPNSADAATISAAADVLTAWVAAGTAFDSATYLDRLASGEVVVAQGFNSDVLQAKQRNDDLDFVIPEAGGTRWIDSMAIPADATNPDGANEMIEFVLRPEIAALNSIANRVDTGNRSADASLPADLLADPAVFPPSDVAARLVFLANLGDIEDRYRDAWSALRG
jgi:spermidine/putrescine transport system substrate-binding protein